MSFVDEETRDAPPVSRSLDAICVAVGTAHYVRNHRLGDLHIETPGGRSSRLSVSRFYWDLEPPVAVDFVRELRYGELELAAKKAYCKRHEIRYLLVKDAFDGESAEAELTKSLPPEAQTEAAMEAGKPQTGPRRRPPPST